MLEIKNNLFKANYDSKGKKGEAILTGAFIGAGVGAVGGAMAGSIKAQNEIKKVPVESVTITYKEPVYETKEIGKIPRNQYVRTWGWFGGQVDLTPTEPVYEKVPIKDESGKVFYKEVTKTFTDHGKPVVNYNTVEVKEPVFNGYTHYVRADYYVDCYSHEHSDGTMHEHCTQEILGYWFRFTPKIDYKVIDTYQVPEVKFEHGVDVGGMILKGLALGTAVGAVMGGVIGAVVYSISQMDKEEKKDNQN